jgi:hypothetical protein
MRKALITMILAATAATPVAAWAQEEDNGRVERIRQRIEQRQQARTERREQPQEQRSEPRVEQREARQPVQVQADPQIRAINRRGERNLARSSDGGISADQSRGERRQERYDTRGSDGHDHDHDTRGGDHRDLHRDLNREHRELHRDDPTRSEHRQWHRDTNADHREVHRETHRDLHNDGVTRREHRRFHREWDRTSWRNDNRYDWQSWRYRNRSLFRLSPYYSPFRNHRYSRFSIGLFLQPSYYSQRYWLSDPWQYRLPYAPPGTQWVRYYNDVLLVDTWSGEVIDVIYDFFW